jgi:hypothetical protein
VPASYAPARMESKEMTGGHSVGSRFTIHLNSLREGNCKHGWPTQARFWLDGEGLAECPILSAFTEVVWPRPRGNARIDT